MHLSRVKKLIFLIFNKQRKYGDYNTVATLLMRDKKFDEAATVIYENKVSKNVINFVADNTEDYVSRALLRMKLNCQYQK